MLVSVDLIRTDLSRHTFAWMSGHQLACYVCDQKNVLHNLMWLWLAHMQIFTALGHLYTIYVPQYCRVPPGLTTIYISHSFRSTTKILVMKDLHCRSITNLIKTWPSITAKVYNFAVHCVLTSTYYVFVHRTMERRNVGANGDTSDITIRSHCWSANCKIVTLFKCNDKENVQFWRHWSLFLVNDWSWE